jgi:hypothetical protein
VQGRKSLINTFKRGKHEEERNEQHTERKKQEEERNAQHTDRESEGKKEKRERERAGRGGERELELAWGAVPITLRHVIQRWLEAGHVPSTNSQPSAPQRLNSQKYSRFSDFI